jgi:thiosulfate/3-mercaptopyruvate sulfurtransferase
MHPLVSTAELAGRLDDPALVIVDVRHDLMLPDWGEARYREAHIPGARFVHLDRDLATRKTGRNGRHPLPSPEEAAAVFSALGIDETRTVVVYDQGGGMYAARLWWMLRWLGHDAAALLDGGFDKWTREGRPVTTDVPPSEPRTFVARAVGPTLSPDDVARALSEGTSVLVDARAAERFRGDAEPIDPVAGHIPGARNRPYAMNLDADGTFKPADALRREFAGLLGDTPLSQVVHYCGSGVTSCHNILAMEIAGLPGTRLYSGSWSEWSADPARPVAVGDA